MEKGHVKAQCCGDKDRSKDCYRCGGPGHIARECTLQVHCPVCADMGRPADHRAGSRICKAPKKKKMGEAAIQPPQNKQGTGKANSSKEEKKKKPLILLQKEYKREEAPPLPSTSNEGMMEVEPLEQRIPRRRQGKTPEEVPPPSDGEGDNQMEAESEELDRQT
ncbi:uncharacterized protein LOC112638883 [Camponotus floridanus]|uniref:uncharacterized protein LOC112638883 n=1 Tax=Camponotus floridanus TaxID=104421 RepID=UPI000DC69D3D|nr:uncharacterized protein LOC112638883 [Camponotus floridanus]